MGSGLRGRWVAWRNGWLASPSFQRRAWRWPFFRTIARQRASALFDLVAGFTYSQLLFAAVRLDLLPLLANAPRTAADVAAACDLPPESAEKLLRGLAALGLTEAIGDGRYALGQHGAALAGNAGVLAMIDHHDRLYADLADPVALLRQRGGGQLSGFWPYAEGASGDVAPYSRLMAASQPMVAESVLDSFSFTRFRCLMDVGGGEGAFLSAVGARYPALKLHLFDLPDVARRAAERLPATAQTFGGRFPDDPLPTGADIISLVRIVHDHDDETVRALLKRVAQALPPGGTILIAEPLANAAGAERMGDAYFGMYLLAMGSGRPRSSAEIGTMLRQSGFTRIRRHRTPNPFAAQLLSARTAP